MGRYFGMVQNRDHEVLYRISGYWRDDVIDHVKSAAIALWKSGYLLCSVEAENGDVGEWFSIYDRDGFRK